MSMYTLLRNKALPSMDDVEVAFQGNLCRCTGYRPILEGFQTLTSNGMSGGGCSGKMSTGGCCMEKENGLGEGKMSNGGCCKDNGIGEAATTLFEPSEFKPFDPTQEPIFPAELQVRKLLQYFHNLLALIYFPKYSQTSAQQ